MSRAEKTEALIESTRRVIERSGIRGATYRAIAREADEPLGTVSYYFPSLRGLIETTIRNTMDRHLAFAGEWFAGNEGSPAIDLVVEWFSSRNAEEDDVERGYVLYLAAISQPELRPLAAEWIGGYVEILGGLLGDRSSAEMVDALIDACFVRRMLTGEMTEAQQASLRRSVAGILWAHGVISDSTAREHREGAHE